MTSRLSQLLAAMSLALALVVPLAGAPDARAQEAQEVPQGTPEAPPQDSGQAAPQAEPKQEVPQAADQAAAVEDRTLSSFVRALDRWDNEIKAAEKAIATQATTDDELRELPQSLEALREQIVRKRGELKPKLQDARERLAKLGPPPKEDAPKESDEVAQQRQSLENEVASLDGKLKQADVLFLRAGQVIDQANDERRDRFTDSLFRPAPNFYTSILPSALENLPKQFSRIGDEAETRFERLWDKGILVILLLVLMPLFAAVGTNRLIERIAGVKPEPEPQDEELTLHERGIAAIKATLRTCLPIWAGLAAFYLVGTASGLAAPGLNGFLLNAVLAIAWAVLLASVVREALVPKCTACKIIPSTEVMAWRVATLLWLLIGVWLIDNLLVLKDVIVFTPYQITVLRAAAFGVLYGLLIAAVLWTVHRGMLMNRAAFSGWRAWLFSILAVAAGVILLAVLLEYESLARFIGYHAVTTAGILWIMYLLHLAAESISSVSVISGQTLDDNAEDEDMGAPSLLTMRLIFSLLLDIAILAVGITVLLLLWRFDWVEVKSWIQAAFFGFQFGPLRISLQSLLVALGVFALGLALTRFVQRWLTGRVFAGRTSESGLHESVRIGIGYLGFVLAALASISYLGVDFSNLAIVAGALSVGIGFGLQSIFNNFVSGLILLAERPIKIGDYIQVGDQEGTVKKISVRSTEIETIYRQSVIIPNATLITDPVVNWMHLDKSCRLDLAVGVDYNTDIELMRSTLLQVAHDYRGVLKSPPPLVHFAGFGDSSLDFELRVFLRDVRQRIRSSSDLRFAMLAALREANITIPFPQSDVHLKSGQAADAAPEEGTMEPSGADGPHLSARKTPSQSGGGGEAR